MPLKQSEILQVYDEMKAVVGFARTPTEMTFSEEAWRSWESIYPELTADVQGEIGALTDRGEAQIIRLSMIYAVLDQSDTIEVDHLAAATAVWEYCSASVSGIFRRSRSKFGLKLEQLLERKDRVTRLEYSAALNRNATDDELDAGEQDLIRAGLCTVEFIPSGGRGGRPTKVYVRTSHHEDTKERNNSLVKAPGVDA